MPNSEVLEKYDNVKLSLEKAIKASDDMELSGADENAELLYIRDTLERLNNDFKTEIERLEESSEWDKLCIAFFGETNAGKSTIIEALRIVYDEESRREKINLQRKELQENVLIENNQYSELVNTLSQLNQSLELQKKSKLKKILIGTGLVLIGFLIGFVISYMLF